MSEIFKNLNGKNLTVLIDSNETDSGTEKTTSGILIPKNSSGVNQYKLATVVQVGEDIKEKYKKGDRVMLVPEPREKPIEYNNEEVQLIPEGVIIGVVNA